jgi:hypothetical protein
MAAAVATAVGDDSDADLKPEGTKAEVDEERAEAEINVVSVELLGKVEGFAEKHGLDERARQKLSRAPDDVAKQILAKGLKSNVKNPSAYVSKLVATKVKEVQGDYSEQYTDKGQYGEQHPEGGQDDHAEWQDQDDGCGGLDGGDPEEHTEQQDQDDGYGGQDGGYAEEHVEEYDEDDGHGGLDGGDPEEHTEQQDQDDGYGGRDDGYTAEHAEEYDENDGRNGGDNGHVEEIGGECGWTGGYNDGWSEGGWAS